VGKETGETAHIERWNNTLRQQLARFLRKTLSFSKCVKMHEICLKLFIHRYNTELLPIVGWISLQKSPLPPGERTDELKVTGEILNGQLYTQSRPSKRHAYVASRIDRSIGRGYGDGIDGPGGWWIFAEPEIHFVRNVDVVVPDLAG